MPPWSPVPFPYYRHGGSSLCTPASLPAPLLPARIFRAPRNLGVVHHCMDGRICIGHTTTRTSSELKSATIWCKVVRDRRRLVGGGGILQSPAPSPFAVSLIRPSKVLVKITAIFRFPFLMRHEVLRRWSCVRWNLKYVLLPDPCYQPFAASPHAFETSTIAIREFLISLDKANPNSTSSSIGRLKKHQHVFGRETCRNSLCG